MDNPQIQTTQSGSSTSTPMHSAALDHLLSDEAVSSQQNNAAQMIADAQKREGSAIQGAAAQRDFSQGRAQTNFDVATDTLTQRGTVERMGMREGRGMATSMAQFQVFDDTINKQMNALTQQKEDALRAADMDYYQSISAVQLETMQIRMQATQQAFTNMLGIAGIGQKQQEFMLQQDAFDLSAEGQKFQQDQAIGSIALEFGLETKEGDTLEDVINRAMPLASEQKRLQLEQVRAQIASSNAQAATARAQAGEIARRASDRVAQNKYLQGLSPEDLAILKKAGEIDTAMLLDAGRTDAVQLIADEGRALINGAAQGTVKTMRDEGNDNLTIRDTVSKLNPYLTPDEIDLLMVEEQKSEGLISKGIKYLTETYKHDVLKDTNPAYDWVNYLPKR